MSISERLAAISADVGAVRKNDRNEHQRFNFRGIDAVVNAVHPALVKHSVTVIPEVLEHHYEQIEVGKNRTLTGHCRLLAAFTFAGPEGDFVRAVVAAEAMDAGDKAYPKAMSVALRTALLQTLCLPTDEPDPDHDTYERAPATDVDTLARGIAVADLPKLRDLWTRYHDGPQWSEIEPLIAHRRAELEARDEG